MDPKATKPGADRLSVLSLLLFPLFLMIVRTMVRPITVEVFSCRDGLKPFATFEIPNTGYDDLNWDLAEQRHKALYGTAYECNRCAGGDYHYERYIRVRH